MLEKLTLQSMQPLLDAEFRVMENSAVRTTLALVEVRDLMTPATAPRKGMRAPFSLLFRASHDFRVPQGTLTLANDVLGSLDIFVVPVDEDEGGIYYEANFN